MQHQKEKCTKSIQHTNGFISKLQQILLNSQFNHLVRWIGNGCFEISNAKAFEKNVLPLYFKHRKIASFVRQLNMYNFHKVRRVQTLTFRNDDFFVDHSSDIISRKKVKPGSKALITIKNEESDCHSKFNRQVGNAEIEPSIAMDVYDDEDNLARLRNISLVNFESGQIIGGPSVCSIILGEAVPIFFN